MTVEDGKTHYFIQNNVAKLASCEYFSVNLLTVNARLSRDYYCLNSFVVLLCVKGSATITYQDNAETINIGELLFIPAAINNITISSENNAELLEVYIEG